MTSRAALWALAALAVIAPWAHGQALELGQPARLDIPDVTLVDQDGVSHRVLSELIRGKVALVSFVFTGCTTICSPVGATMGALDRLLGPAAAAHVSLLSITLDPFNDTPSHLADWRRQFDDGPGWRLLTGDPARVHDLLHAMRQDVADLTQHDAFLWLGDPHTGRWSRVSALASPEQLASVVQSLAAP